MWLCPGWAQLQLCLDKSCLQVADNRSDHLCSLITPWLSTLKAAQCCRCPEQRMVPSRKRGSGVGSVALEPRNRALQSWAGWEGSPCSAEETRGCFAWTQGRIWPFEFGVCLGREACAGGKERNRGTKAVCAVQMAGAVQGRIQTHGSVMNVAMDMASGSCVTQCSSREPSLQAGIAQSSLVASSLTGNE